MSPENPTPVEKYVKLRDEWQAAEEAARNARATLLKFVEDTPNLVDMLHEEWRSDNSGRLSSADIDLAREGLDRSDSEIKIRVVNGRECTLNSTETAILDDLSQHIGTPSPPSSFNRIIYGVDKPQLIDLSRQTNIFASLQKKVNARDDKVLITQGRGGAPGWLLKEGTTIVRPDPPPST